MKNAIPENPVLTAVYGAGRQELSCSVASPHVLITEKIFATFVNNKCVSLKAFIFDRPDYCIDMVRVFNAHHIQTHFCGRLPSHASLEFNVTDANIRQFFKALHVLDPIPENFIHAFEDISKIKLGLVSKRFTSDEDHDHYAAVNAAKRGHSGVLSKIYEQTNRQDISKLIKVTEVIPKEFDSIFNNYNIANRTLHEILNQKIREHCRAGQRNNEELQYLLEARFCAAYKINHESAPRYFRQLCMGVNEEQYNELVAREATADVLVSFARILKGLHTSAENTQELVIRKGHFKEDVERKQDDELSQPETEAEDNILPHRLG